VFDPDVVLGGVNVRIGVRARLAIEQQGVANDLGLGALGAMHNAHQAAKAGAPVALADRLRRDHRTGVGREVDGFGARVVVLVVAGKRDRQHLTPRSWPAQDHGGILHRHAASQVAVDPLHQAILVDDGPLGDQVVDVARPVLNGGVAGVGALLDEDLNDAGVERCFRVLWGRAALNVVDVAAFLGNDDRALELDEALGIDAEVGL